MARAAAIALCVAASLASASGQPAPDALSTPATVSTTGAVSTPAAHSAWLTFDEPGRFDALLTWFPPYFVRAGTELKDFIRSDAFAAYRAYAGDARAVDAIYVRAMALTANNTSLALLAAAVATFDHDVVGLDVPVFALFLPLTNESRADFDARVRNLPARFYSDSPPDGHGDRDKLQHFFGSAWVSFSFESRGAAARVGNFVEEGEQAVIVGGVRDARDQRANWNGSEFGAALLADNRRYPSEFLRAPIATGSAERVSPWCDAGVPASPEPGAVPFSHPDPYFRAR